MSNVQKELEIELRERLINNYRETIHTHKELQFEKESTSFYDCQREIIINAVNLEDYSKDKENQDFKNIKILKKEKISGKFMFSGIEIRADFTSIWYIQSEGHLILGGRDGNMSVFKISEKMKKIQNLNFDKLDLSNNYSCYTNFNGFIVKREDSAYVIFKFSENEKYEISQILKTQKIADARLMLNEDLQTMLFIAKSKEIEVWTLNRTSNMYEFSMYSEGKNIEILSHL